MSIILDKIDPSKGDITGQMEEIQNNLTPEEIAEIKKSPQKLNSQAESGSVKQGMNAAARAMAMMFAPFIQNKIVVDGSMMRLLTILKIK